MNHLVQSVFEPLGQVAQAWRPLADLSETDDGYLVEVEVPGVKREDISIEVAGNELTISGEFEEKEKVGWFRSRTRRTGRFEYRAVLPQDVDTDRISANLAEGVLTVTVPKAAAATRRRIEIAAQ
jgi:HSP20 family protein